MKRVLVLGQAGAGRSHFAAALGEITGLPVFHMDRGEKTRLVHEIISGDEWILEGGLSATCPERVARADTAIWLDLPLGVRTRRIIRCRWQYRGGRTRPDLSKDCPERLDPAFLHFLWRTRHSAREKLAQALAGAPHLDIHHIRTTEGANTLLNWIRDDHQNCN